MKVNESEGECQNASDHNCTNQVMKSQLLDSIKSTSLS